jgi:hypothetical protein
MSASPCVREKKRETDRTEEHEREGPGWIDWIQSILMDWIRGKASNSGALQNKNEKENQEIKKRRYPESKQFACGGLYLKRLANWMSKEARRANSMSNIEICEKNLVLFLFRNFEMFGSLGFILSSPHRRFGCQLGVLNIN